MITTIDYICHYLPLFDFINQAIKHNFIHYILHDTMEKEIITLYSAQNN